MRRTGWVPPYRMYVWDFGAWPQLWMCVSTTTASARTRTSQGKSSNHGIMLLLIPCRHNLGICVVMLCFRQEVKHGILRLETGGVAESRVLSCMCAKLSNLRVILNVRFRGTPNVPINMISVTMNVFEFVQCILQTENNTLLLMNLFQVIMLARAQMFVRLPNFVEIIIRSIGLSFRKCFIEMMKTFVWRSRISLVSKMGGTIPALDYLYNDKF